MKTTEEIPNCN